MSDNSILRLRQAARQAAALCLALACALLALVALHGAVAAQSTTQPTVRPDPAAITATQGQTVTVNFVVEGIANLYGADVRGQFDPALLEVVDANPAAADVQIQPGAFLKPDFVVRQVADNAAGTIWYASTQVSPTLPVSGTGALFTVVFRAKSDVTQAPITVTHIELVDRNGQALLTWEPSATGQQPAAPTLAPTETAAPVATAAPVSSPTPANTTAPAATVAAAATDLPASSATGTGVQPLCAPPGIFVLGLGVVLAGGAGWWARRRAVRR